MGDVADWGSGGTPKRGVAEYFGGDVPWLSIADLNDGVVTIARESLTALGIARSSAKIVPAGTLCIAMYGSIGKLGVAGVPVATSQAIAFARPKSDLVDDRYLFHFLLAERPKLQSRGRGGTQMNIGQGDLKSWPIPLPTLPEQRRIAAILDHTDSLRAKRRRMVASLRSLPDSVFRDMFEGCDRDLIPLAEVADVASGITKGRRTAEQTRPVPYLSVSNVQAGHLRMENVKQIDATDNEIARYALHDGDLVLTEGGDPDKLGRGTVWRGELGLCLHQNHVFRVRIRESSGVEPDYLAAYTASRAARAYFLRSAKQTTGIATINSTQLKALPVPVPSSKAQATFVARLAVITQEREVAKRALTAGDELFAALQSRAFRGDL